MCCAQPDCSCEKPCDAYIPCDLWGTRPAHTSHRREKTMDTDVTGLGKFNPSTDITNLPREDLENLVDEQRALLEGAHEALTLAQFENLIPSQWAFIEDLKEKIAVELGL